MCYAIFIATTEPQQTGEFMPDITKLYLKLPEDKELTGLKDKFTMPYVYYVGSAVHRFHLRITYAGSL